MLRKNLETISHSIDDRETDAGGSSPDQIQIVTAKAQLRLSEYDLRSKIIDFRESDGEKLMANADQEQLKQLMAEASGEALFSPEVTEKILSGRSAIVQKADQMAGVAPLFARLSYATIVKAEQSAGADYNDSWRLAQEIKTGLENESPKAIADFLPDAILLGVLKREINNQEITDIKHLAEMVAANPELLPDCALALAENDREEFLSFLPKEMQQRAGRIWDESLSRVMQGKYLKEADKENRDQLRSRTMAELKRTMSATAEAGGVEMVKILAETMANLEDEESQKLLQDLIGEILAGDGWQKNKTKTIKIIRQLSKLDGFTGNGLMMKLLGQEALDEKRFDYLSDKIFQEGYLAKNLDQMAGWPEDRCQKVFALLKEKEAEWQDEANVLKPFENGVKIFGWRKMFKYAGRPDVSRHDALFAFDKIIDLYHQSGLSAEKFFADVLNQVSGDSSNYEEGNSYHHFNSIANSLDLSDGRLAEIKANAGKFKIKELRELTENFNSKDKILASWPSLRNYVGLLWILEQGEILEELSELENEGKADKRKEKLAKFIKVLAFHRDSKVDKASIIEFWREPDQFLARMDDHTPENIQNSRKPSNYLEIDHLDLAGDELRDALIDGGLDRIQAFPPMEGVYEISLASEDAREASGFMETIRRELGSFKESTANKPLFNEVRKILKEAGIKIVDFLEKPDENEIFAGLSAVELKEIRAKITAAMEKFPNVKLERNQTAIKKRYRAKVNLKSDPQAILAGNDTACCMPFGSGKNNIYMFNPNCGLFTLEEEKGNGEWKTIAQSVLTLDVDAGVKVPEIVTAIQKSSRISEILPDQILEQRENFLACDNIEVAGNAKGKEKIIKEIYRKFFEAYLKYYNSRQPAVPLNQDKLVIGQANSDVRFGVSEDNTFVPVAPVGYSDKLGSKIDALHFKQAEKSGVIVSEQSVNQQAGEALNQKTGQGVSALTFRDVLATALLEDKAYADNQSLMYHLDLMENSLIAKDINNAVKNRPNMSLKFNDKSGRLRGYLLSYEGRGDNGEPMIYVSDLASDRRSKVAGGGMIFAFLDKYKEEYLDQGNPVPVLMEAREGTSYDLIMNNLDKIAKRTGVKLKVKEISAYNSGQDKMHRLLITAE